jgi:DNA-binding response OmpR family regulator
MQAAEWRKRKTIVVVNDSPELLALMQDLLEEEGYRAVVCDQGGRAYRLIKETRPSLVILEAALGDLPLWHVLDLVKLDPQTAAIPVLVCSAAHREVREMEARLRAHGCEVLLKPFNLDELLEKVAGLLA